MEGVEKRMDEVEQRWMDVVEDFDTAFPPVIDFSRSNHSSPLERSLLVTNHGISPSIIEDALSSAAAFFALPAEEKSVYASKDLRKSVRYDYEADGPSDELITTRRMLLKHYAHPLQHWINLWPSKPTHYKEKMGKYADEAWKLALNLIGIVMESLGVEPRSVQGRFEDGTQVMAINDYPAASKTPARPDDPFLRLPAHTDFGCITLLLQTRPGLQVLDPIDGKWKWAPTPPGSLHVHLGDHLQVLTNGSYRGLNHRVVHSGEKERLSVASIHSLAMHHRIEVLDALVDEQNPRAYRGTSFAEFLDFISGDGTSSSSSSNNGVISTYIDSLKIPEN
ncbi:hypothetical protein H6P81_007380 [Aristolochia fimbriata]|uniref:Fe2OG dioxygenase domain-containing protein n=1 Tax=Aristolochia fimbriata TaxID=158543 RepID=A0AAV7F189_ARIFI|nr:hypothetical protein H6P81_007380 [Aristolochia fimbriata]